MKKRVYIVETKRQDGSATVTEMADGHSSALNAVAAALTDPNSQVSRITIQPAEWRDFQRLPRWN